MVPRMSTQPDDSIYLNAAGHGLPDPRARARILAHLAREQEIGPMNAASEAGEEIAAVREKAAALVNAHVDEIAFSISSSQAWAIAVAALPLRGRRILVARHEWASNLEALRRLGNSARLELQTIAAAPDGGPDMAALAAALDGDVAAICVPMVSSLTGTRYPVEDIGALPRPDGCFYVVDAAQALGQMPVDMGAIGCDLLTATTRKWLRSPRGNALICATRNTLGRMTPTLFPNIGRMVPRDRGDGFDDVETAARFEDFDFNVAIRLGLGAAFDVAADAGVASIAEAIGARTAHVRERIGRAGLALFSPAQTQSGITTFRLPAEAAREAARRLAEARITVKFPDDWNEPLLPPAPEGEAIVRVAPHVYNTVGEIDRLFDVIDACL